MGDGPIVLQTSSGELRLTFGYDCWVSIGSRGSTSSGRARKTRELAALLTELGLPRDEAAAVAAAAWSRRPRDAAHGPAIDDPWTSPWDRGKASIAMFALGAILVALFALARAGVL